MTKNLLGQKIPTIIGLFLLIIGIGAAFFLVSQGKIKLKQEPTALPKQINITNVQDNQFTVSWITEEKTAGFIKLGESPTKLKISVKDNREQLSGEKGSFLLHYVTLSNLEPSQTYYFKIGSGSVLYDNNGQPYSVTTGPTLGSTGEAKIASGRILNQDNTPAENIIVYLNSPNLAPLSALTDKEGRWAIFLNKARVSDLSSYTVFDPEATILTLEAEGEKQTVSAKMTTKNAFPVPDIVLGHAPYDFIEEFVAEEEPMQAEAALQKEAPSQFVLQPIASPSASPASYLATTPQVTIENPATAGEEINTTLPQIQGKGPALKVLTIRIESPNSQSSTVTIDEDGNWSFIPSKELTPGEHTVYVSYVDEQGATKTISRNFVVLAAGSSELPAFTATPSGQTVPSPSPSASPKASPSPSPKTSPSPGASPVTRVSLPATEGGVPTTGIVAPTFFVFITGLLLIISGIAILIVIDKANRF